MNQVLTPAVAVLFSLALGACGNANNKDPAETTESAMSVTAPEVSFTPGPDSGATAKPGGPVTIGYRIIGNPAVGQPVAIELQFTSMSGSQTISVSYRVNDATALQIPETQATTVSMAAFAEGQRGSQQVTVIPLREGRLYLNVSAQIETENGSMSSVTAIPIEVGGGRRESLPNGERSVDENGEAVMSLPAKEN
jgi:hypothetical protein